jgi:cellulose 1,4-beta-cellobiosidase
MRAAIFAPILRLSVDTCTPDSTTSLTLDSNWRWTHQVGSTTNCYTGDEWDAGICPDPVTCAANCALDGADYPGIYGVRVAGDTASFKLVTVGPYDTNIGARTYVMDSPTTYKQYKVKNREFVFDADVSKLPCGLNGALYFVDMDADGDGQLGGDGAEIKRRGRL